MRAHDENAAREISAGVPAAARAAAVWRDQRQLQHARSRAHNGPPRHAEEAALAARVGAGRAAVGGPVFRIARAALPDLRRRIDALDRRAQRLGCAPIGLLEQDASSHDSHVFVVLRGTAPVLAGWTLIAIVEHRATGTTVRALNEQGEQLDARELGLAHCDHCQLTRRRSTTYVVRHEQSGAQRRVGSSCLRDFLGGHDPGRICHQAEYLARARDALASADETDPAPPTPERSPTQRSDPVAQRDAVALELFAVHAARVIRAHGFRSRRQAQRDGGLATVDLALQGLGDEHARPDGADRALAAGALRWGHALPALKTQLTDFERDATGALSGPLVDRRQGGLVSALIAAYRGQRARSQHLGIPNASLQLTVLVEHVDARPSERYPSLRRCDLLDAHANRLVWWQTAGEPLVEGQLVVLSGRVARHTHFGAAAVTVLTRCRQHPPPAGATNIERPMEALGSRSLT